MQTDQSIVGYRPKNDYNASMLFRVGLNEKQLSDFIPFRDNWTKEAKEAIEALCTPIYREPEQKEWTVYKSTETGNLYLMSKSLSFKPTTICTEEQLQSICDQLNRPAGEPSQVSDELVDREIVQKFTELQVKYRGASSFIAIDLARWVQSKSSPQKKRTFEVDAGDNGQRFKG